MPTIPRSAINEYTRGINAASKSAQDGISDELLGIDWDRPIAEVRDQVIEVMDDYCETATDTAATIAAEYYDASREFAVGEPLGAAAISNRNPEATERSVRAFMQELVDGNTPEAVMKLCRERVDYEVKKAAADCIGLNTVRDGRKPRYARVPDGAETCAFCIMLASRGPVYRSADTAGEGNHFHDNCDCRIVPIWGSKYKMTESGGVIRRGGTQIEGYDPEALFDEYLARMEDPHFQEQMRAAADRAHARHRDSSGKTGRLNWAIANGEGLTTYHDIHEVTAAIRGATSYQELFEVITTVNEEMPLYGLSKRRIQNLQKLCNSMRTKLLAAEQ